MWVLRALSAQFGLVPLPLPENCYGFVYMWYFDVYPILFCYNSICCCCNVVSESVKQFFCYNLQIMNIIPFWLMIINMRKQWFSFLKRAIERLSLSHICVDKITFEAFSIYFVNQSKLLFFPNTSNSFFFYRTFIIDCNIKFSHTIDHMLFLYSAGWNSETIWNCQSFCHHHQHI